MKIETDYIKREAQKECYWLQGGTFDLVTWTQAMMQNAADRAGSKIRQLEVALRIKTEQHDCCAADLLEARKDSERLEWLMRNVSGKEFRRLGVHYGGNCGRDRIDAAMNAENPEWQNAVQAAFGGIGQTPQG